MEIGKYKILTNFAMKNEDWNEFHFLRQVIIVLEILKDHEDITSSMS